MKNICDWDNCNNTGEFKAPIERDNSKKFRLLCLEHIKIFNKKWNYFSNMSNEEIEFFIKSDLTWHKSTKTFGSSDNFFNILWNNALNEKFNFFGHEEKMNGLNSGKLSEKDKEVTAKFDYIMSLINRGLLISPLSANLNYVAVRILLFCSAI